MIELILASALRIVSLAPALTEDLFAIGAGSQVIGVDAYSDRPAAAARLPRVGGLRDVSAEAVLALHPDLVVGIPYEARELADLARTGVRTESLTVDDLDDDVRAIERLGALSGHVEAAHALHRRIIARLASLATRAQHARRLSAFVALGGGELRTAGRGTFLDDLLRLANVRNIAGTDRVLWPQYSAEWLVAQQPDVIVVPTSHPPMVGPPWDRLAALRAGHVVEIDEDDMLRPGPRVAAVLQRLIDATARWR